jgi:hypothetical protein
LPVVQSPSFSSTVHEILGPLAASPTVKELLNQGAVLNETQLLVIKGILQRVPAAQADLRLFSELLEKEPAT